MKRLIENWLEGWKSDPSRKPLVLIGARQIGKTYSITEFASKNYKKVITINFQDNISAREFFIKSRSAQEIIDYIEINYIGIVLDDSTCIFFDEVQVCPELLTSLKYLKEKCKSDIICSGSMLGVKLHETSSWPVGYVTLKVMHPMTFIEFAKATSIPDRFFDEVKDSIDNDTEISEAVHNKLNELFLNYMICGGLPEAVEAYISKGISESIIVNRRLANDYRIDIAKYADGGTKVKAQECFDSIPLQLSKDNKKFIYGTVKAGRTGRYYGESIDWLKDAGLIYKTHRLKNIQNPLKAHIEQNVFKVYMFDTGILVSQFDDAEIYNFIDDAMGTYKGALYENMMAQILNYSGINNYYYEPTTQSEIDFIINTKYGITPIEVKAGLHTRSKSFDNFIKNHDVKRAVRFSKKNVGTSEDGVTKYLPMYAAELWISENCGELDLNNGFKN